MKISSLFFAAPLCAAGLALLAGCISTPQKRIEKNPAVYAGLNKSHQALASRGKIEEGMSPEAVFIAWGRPDSVKTSSDGGRVTETWIYQGSEPVYVNSFHGGYGYGRHYEHGYYHPAHCYGPSVYYRSYVAGKVTFRNGRVVQWEVLNR